MDPLILPEELKEKARVELHETDEVRPGALVALREAFRTKYPQLVSRDDDRFLIRFLRARKFDINRAVELLHNYEQFRRDHPDWFVPLTSDEIQKCIDLNFQFFLPARDVNGCAVTVLLAKNMNLSQVSLLTLNRFSILVSEKLIDDVYTQVNGMVMLEDMKDFSMKTIMFMSGSEQKDAFKWMQDCFPLRFKGVHLINPPWFLSVLNAIVRPFLSAKLASRLRIYGSDLTKLHQQFNPKDIPAEFGGSLSPETDLWAFIREYINQAKQREQEQAQAQK